MFFVSDVWAPFMCVSRQKNGFALSFFGPKRGEAALPQEKTPNWKWTTFMCVKDQTGYTWLMCVLDKSLLLSQDVTYVVMDKRKVADQSAEKVQVNKGHMSRSEDYFRELFANLLARS